MTFTLQPVVPNPKQTGVDFGAIVEDLDLETISGMFIVANNLQTIKKKGRLVMCFNRRGFCQTV